MPTLCFGDVSRDEINSVLSNAGVPIKVRKSRNFLMFIS